MMVNTSSRFIKEINEMVNAHIEQFMPMYGHHTVSPSKCNNDNIENRYCLDKELFQAVDFSAMGLVKEPKEDIPNFIIGERYALKGMSCEGFEMPEKVYELVAIHDEFDGININSLIVKQVSGEQDKIFTLSKNDCDHIGIEYENGLQLFPKRLNWRRVKDTIPFDSNNLSTTPTSDIDNTIRYIVLKLYGFKDYADGYIQTPSGKIIKEQQFEKTLKVVNNEPIVYIQPSNRNRGVIVRENTILNTEIVYPDGMNFKHGNFISSDDNIYVLVKLAKRFDSNTSIDGFCGVERNNFEGFNPNEYLTISWDELGAYTVEEYEAEKARKEKERQEKIAKAEAERKRKVEEEEKRIREQRKRKKELINQIDVFQSNFSTFYKLFDANSTNSLEAYADTMQDAFNRIESNLNKLNQKFYYLNI